MHDNNDIKQHERKEERVKKKGYFRKRYGTTKDPVIPFLRTEDDNRKDEYYKKHFTDLLVLIVTHFSKNINYAHFNLFIPKNDLLPLRWEGSHMDISYMTNDKCIVFIQFHVANPSRVKKEWPRLF